MENCYHCGQPCVTESQKFEDKSFCCAGCKTVYEILQANDLCEYYDLNSSPGVRKKDLDPAEFSYLDDPGIRQKILEFDSSGFSRVKFFIPAVHCISCIWLLENLPRIDRGVLRSELNFPHKTALIDFDPEIISLSKLASLLASIGYTPQITLDSEVKPSENKDHSPIIKLAIAAFCFGNVMLLSFPEYLGIDNADQKLLELFSWLNIGLSVPVLLYSGSDYLRSAWSSFKYRHISIDVPIAIGLLTLFIRSFYDIVSGTGAGYLDSFTGLVFFLLLGRWFQGKTYESLAFDRDYKSYFPLAVQRWAFDDWKPVVIYELNSGDTIRIRNMEIIPADSELLDADALIDYSFVTGEARPVKVRQGELTYAGGRLIGQPVRLKVQRKTSHSKLTGLWNHEVFRKADETRTQRLLDSAAQGFTWTVLAVTLVTGMYWYFLDAEKMWLVVTAVMMVACPCALALTAPFTYGSMLRFFGRNGFYLKNAEVIERIARINIMVFDKTGTITHDETRGLSFDGVLSDREQEYVKTISGFSTHPLSKSIHGRLPGVGGLAVSDFHEYPGKGIEGIIEGVKIQLGSPDFAGNAESSITDSSRVYVSVDGEVRGYFRFVSAIREGVKSILSASRDYRLALISGDNDSEEARMRTLFGERAAMKFNQSPGDKLSYIKTLREEGGHVMMFGDGLNDSGALKQSDVGIAVTDDTGIFSPASDGILQGDQLRLIPKFLRLSKAATHIVRAGFIISFIYNAFAIGIAVAGYLTPLTAAILMPLSSISVVLFSTAAVTVVGERIMSVANAEEVEEERRSYVVQPVTN